MAIVHICDTCNERMEGSYYIILTGRYDTCDERMEGSYYIISTGRYDNVCYLGDEEHERYEICPKCFDLIKAYIGCMLSDADTLKNIIAGDNHDES